MQAWHQSIAEQISASSARWGGCGRAQTSDALRGVGISSVGTGSWLVARRDDTWLVQSLVEAHSARGAM